MPTKAPNYRIMLSLVAIEPRNYEMAWLEVHAKDDDEAYTIASFFIRYPETRIVSISPIERK